jgi:glycosyltransferase involved in cell wall biosynthesis
LTRGVNPNKLYEYLAAGIPVVTTRFSEEVLGYTDVVKAVDAGDEFNAACEKTIAELSDGRRAAEIRETALQAAQENDWNVIAETFWKKVAEMGDQKR